MSYEEIEIRHADVSATIAPARGALVSGLIVRGRDVLYLDDTTFCDPAKNVRGGIPVLFPFAGKLENETLKASNTKMKQHGFGRNKAWHAVERKPDMLRVQLQSDAETHAVYPYEFRAEQTCTVLPRGLLVELSIANLDTNPLPVSPGWHPYFHCGGASKNSVTCDAPGFPPEATPSNKEFDFGIPAPADGRVRCEIPALGELTLSFSPEMRHLQFWSQPGKDFICIEPFFGPNNTINTPGRFEISPRACHNFWMRIELN
jgi:galactose mutarotase-like enzyme